MTIEKLIDLTDKFNNYDIVLLCETWLKSNHYYDMNIQGFKSLSVQRSQTNQRAKRGSGGLICYMKNKIEEGIAHITCTTHCEDRLWFKVSTSFFDFDRDIYLA